MTDFSDIKKRWLRDPEVRTEYDALEEEFALARELILARSRAGLSQAEVARRMGTTQSTVARLESGRSKPTLQSIERYANATGTRAVVQLVGARGDVNLPPSTRDLRETVMARAQRDAGYRAALLTEAAEALLQGEADLSKGILRDLVNATLGFDALAEATGLPVKSLHRMLGAAGNPTLSNLSAILRAVQDHEGLVLHAEATTRGGRGCQVETGRNIGHEVLEGIEDAHAWRRGEMALPTLEIPAAPSTRVKLKAASAAQRTPASAKVSVQRRKLADSRKNKKHSDTR